MSCPFPQKATFATRADARRARRHFPGEHLAAYRCTTHWHLGHLPPAVLHGGLRRGEAFRGTG